MKVKVKICGIRNLESAEVAVNVGADFLGFNFVPTSRRNISIEMAKKIIVSVRKKIKVVGIFQNADVEEVNKISDVLDLDFVQLHGEEDREYIKKVKRPVIKKMNKKLQATQGGEFIILDREVQGKGEMVDLNIAKDIAEKHKIFFSGGLTPENVLYVIKKIKPFAVDVAGGIETNGKQDLKKIKMFIKNVKEVNL